MKYINENNLIKAINEYLGADTIINDVIDDAYDTLNDLCDTYDIWSDTENFDFTPYFVYAGANYIYIMGRRKSDNLEFILDEDFIISESTLTLDLLLNKFKMLDEDLQNFIKEHNL